MTRRISVALLSAAVLAAGCGAPKPPDASGLSEMAGVEIGGECRVPEGAASPMLVDWPAVERTALEGRARKGVVAVRYDRCRLEVVRGCEIPGGYETVETARSRDGFVVRDHAELSAKLPLSVVSLEGEVGGGSSLSLDYVTVGTRTTRVDEVTEDLLSGSCEGATHFVRSMVVGAYALTSSAEVKAGVKVEVSSAGGGVGGGGESAVLRKAGSVEACLDYGTAFDDVRCQAIVQLILEPIGEGTGGPSSPLEGGPATVAVSYFDNTSGDPELEALRKGLADMLITDLRVATGLRVVEREKLEALLGEIELVESGYLDARTAQELGKGLGAQLILTGSYLVHGGKVRLDARVLRVETGEVVAAQSEMGSREGFFEMERGLVGKLVPDLGAEPTEAGRALLAEAPKAEFDAVVAFSRGLDAGDRGDVDAQKEAFRRALEIDPGFTRVRERLDALEGRVDRLESSGGRVLRPETAADFLHNARIQKAEGDYRGALDSLERAARIDPGLVDLWTLVADVAPEDMRGRYMGAAGLTWGVGWSLGPLLAGLMMDFGDPRYVWYGCLIVGLAAAVAFLRLGRWQSNAERVALDDAQVAI